MQHDQASSLIEALFDEVYPLIVHLAYSFSGNVAVAEEFAQDAYVSLFRALLRDEVVEHPVAWLICVVRREGSKHSRRQRLYPLCELHDDLRATQEGAEWYSFDLEKLLDALTPREQEVLLLRAKDLSYGEISASLRISRNSVKTLLARGLRKLRTLAARPHTPAPGARDDDDALSQTLQ